MTATAKSGPMVIWQGRSYRVVWDGGERESVVAEGAYADAMGATTWVALRREEEIRAILAEALAAYAKRVGPVPPEGAAPRGRTRTGEDVA